MSRKTIFLNLLILVLAVVSLAFQRQSGVIEGMVTDQWGPIPGAMITARNVLHGDAVHTATNTNGHYRFDALRPGRYSLWVEAPEHEAVWALQVLVEEGQTTVRNVFLSRGRIDIDAAPLTGKVTQ
jgi:hypothetical protein